MSTATTELEQQEATSRELAEKWLLGNARAIGSFGAQLDDLVEQLRENPNARDTEQANTVWGKVRTRLEWVGLVLARFPGIKEPATPSVDAPGLRFPREGLRSDSPRRLTPVIIMSDPDDLKSRKRQRAAQEWVTEHIAELPDELCAVFTTAPVVPEEAEVIAWEQKQAEARARQDAETRRQLAGLPKLAASGSAPAGAGL